ncbi:serine/threonine protein kinase [Niveomyces insectorum RCEF 264]|uniref:EKC/KEOPS complex subunit BUD32 n=1 Tax=Niveomyces insectorum RCEF 264 TaxID=1081102 RepID=A0A167LUC9_9HYPO|nr:serine/threonine protein kinase [Niveomyces insectorum RCEF 264]
MVQEFDPDPQLVLFGAYGLIYGLSSQVVVKVKRLPRKSLNSDDDLEAEQAGFARLAGGDGLHKQIPCPYIVPVFYQAMGTATFMLRAQYDLRSVIHQEHDRSDGSRLAYRYDPVRTARWMGQLCGAVAFLVETHKLVHGDLRPDNVLVDSNDNLRLADLGASWPVGQRLQVAAEPWGRKLGVLDGLPPTEDHEYGLAGARSETFALGSIYYSLLRGHYPYAHEQYDFFTLMGKFQRKEFPALDPATTPGDAIVARCWAGAYADDATSVSALEQEFRNMGDGTEWYRFPLEDAAWFAETQQACRAWAESGQLEKVLANRTR